MGARRVMVMGAAGRDFHDFNLCFRDNPAFEVVGFTATQIPNISERRAMNAPPRPAVRSTSAGVHSNAPTSAQTAKTMPGSFTKPAIT